MATGELVDPGRWQGVPTEGKPDLQTVELLDYDFRVQMTSNLDYLRKMIGPNLPWADDHFAERVGREPTNPGEEYKNWPWWQGLGQEKKSMIETTEPVVGITKEGEVESTAYSYKFTHTYQERFWPKMAGGGMEDQDDVRHGGSGIVPNYGIRYEYGDLDDLVELLLREPYTRQAYLPIFFPEDTGAVHEGRIPCTLGYQFMLRGDRFHMWYTIRSCDLIRHFQDDIYLAVRLLLWVLSELKRKEHSTIWRNAIPGLFHFKAFTLHYHKGDEHHLKQG